MFVDFDGTIVNQDTAQIALDRFGDPDWVRLDEEYERGEMSFEECLRREFAMLKVPEEDIIREVSRVTQLRPNFSQLVDYCKTRSVPMTVLSGGLDFCIRHFLNRDGWLDFMQIYSPTSKFTKDGYTVTFPRMFAESSTSFKDDLVRHERTKGARVYFVGNGFGDLSAAKESDVVFAIKDSRLAQLCRQHKVVHTEVVDFLQVVDALVEV